MLNAVVRFDVILLSVPGDRKVFCRLQLHKDFASLVAFVFVDLDQSISDSDIFF